MSRDENGRITFTLKDVGVLIGVVTGAFALAGTVGGYYVSQYRLSQIEVKFSGVEARMVANERKATDHDLAFAKLEPQLAYIVQAVGEIKTQQRQNNPR
jgi:hypothetical protein